MIVILLAIVIKRSLGILPGIFLLLMFLFMIVLIVIILLILLVVLLVVISILNHGIDVVGAELPGMP